MEEDKQPSASGHPTAVPSPHSVPPTHGERAAMTRQALTLPSLGTTGLLVSVGNGARNTDPPDGDSNGDIPPIGASNSLHESRVENPSHNIRMYAFSHRLPPSSPRSPNGRDSLVPGPHAKAAFLDDSLDSGYVGECNSFHSRSDSEDDDDDESSGRSVRKDLFRDTHVGNDSRRRGNYRETDGEEDGSSDGGDDDEELVGINLASSSPSVEANRTGNLLYASDSVLLDDLSSRVRFDFNEHSGTPRAAASPAPVDTDHHSHGRKSPRVTPTSKTSLNTPATASTAPVSGSRRKGRGPRPIRRHRRHNNRQQQQLSPSSHTPYHTPQCSSRTPRQHIRIQSNAISSQDQHQLQTIDSYPRIQHRNFTGLTEGSDATGLHHDGDFGMSSQHNSGGSPRTLRASVLVEQIFLLCTFGIIGAVIREFSVRLFGADCEDGDDAVQDFLTPISSHICITAGGRTLQSGGSLFRDLPSNIIGSFLLGLITASAGRISKVVPCFSANNPIQSDKLLVTALTTGFCGCLTSFASWNSQMVVMLDGYHAVLGSQLPSVIFGYLLGVMTCTSAFRFGNRINSVANITDDSLSVSQNDFVSTRPRARQSPPQQRQPLDERTPSYHRSLSLPVTLRRTSSSFSKRAALVEANNKNNDERDIEEEPTKPPSRQQATATVTMNVCCLSSGCGTAGSADVPRHESCQRSDLPIMQWGCSSSTCWLKFLSLFVVVILIFSFSFFGYVEGMSFYKDSFLVAALAPFGVMIRWKLSGWNEQTVPWCRSLSWLPIGTLSANVLASCVSILCSVFAHRAEYREYASLCFGIQVGFAGSLSTVSTFVKEIVQLSDTKHGMAKSIAYVVITIVLSASLATSIYSPLVRQ